MGYYPELLQRESGRLVPEAVIRYAINSITVTDVKRNTNERPALRVVEEPTQVDQPKLQLEAQALRGVAEELERRRTEAEAERQRAEEGSRQAAEREAQLRAEIEARIRAEDEARCRVEEEVGLRKLEEETRLKADLEARAEAQAEARFRLEAETLRRAAEELARKRAEADMARKIAEDETRRSAQEEVRRIAEEESRRLAEKALLRRSQTEGLLREAAERRRSEEEQFHIEQEALLKAADDVVRCRREIETARKKAEEELKRLEENRRRIIAEQKRIDSVRQQAEEAERRLAELERLKVQAEEQVRKREEQEKKIRAEIESLHRAEEEQRQRIKAETRRLAEAEARLGEGKSRLDAEKQARIQAEKEAHLAERLRTEDVRANQFVSETTTDLGESSLETPEVFTSEESWGGQEVEDEPFTASVIASAAVESSTMQSVTKDLDKGIDLIQAEKGIAPFGEESNISAELLHLLNSESPAERSAALADLATLGGEEAFKFISRSFDDQEPEVRNAAARALYLLQADRAASFTKALREGSPERRRKIGASLASSGLADDAIANLTGESREKTYDAFSLLFLMAKAGEVQTLMKAIEDYPNVEVRLAIVKLLALSGQPEIVPAFRRLAVRGSLPSEVRSAVMEAIYQISSQGQETAPSAA